MAYRELQMHPGSAVEIIHRTGVARAMNHCGGHSVADWP